MTQQNRITKDFLESEITNVEYQRLSGTITHCTITVKNGFTFTGESACVDPNNYDQAIGEKIAYDNAFEKMWMPYGFALKQKLGEEVQEVGESMTFGQAIEALKLGEKVARKGWNGKGMFLYYVPAASYPAQRNEKGTMLGVFPNDMVPYCAYIAMKTAQDNVVPWLVSQSDVLAEDWILVK